MAATGRESAAMTRIRQEVKDAPLKIGDLLFVEVKEAPTNESSEDAGATTDDQDHDDGPTNNTPNSAEQERPGHLGKLYVVTAIVHDPSDIPLDLELAPLHYTTDLKDKGNHMYLILGQKCQHQHTAQSTENKLCKEAIKLSTLMDQPSFRNIWLRPDGDFMRLRAEEMERNEDQVCIRQCYDGWLGAISQVREMGFEIDSAIPDEMPSPLQDPVCPVCMGPDLLKEQLCLFETFFQSAGPVPIERIIEFHAQLNSRRSITGCTFKQFDEREWGYLFEDMLYESDNSDGDDDPDAAGGNFGDHFEQWDEVMDPNSEITLNPVSENTLASLPRCECKDTDLGSEDISCRICQIDLQPDSLLIKLPCSHAYFHEACISIWLKHQNTCPTCRAKITNSCPATDDPIRSFSEQEQAVARPHDANASAELNCPNNVANYGDEEEEEEEEEEEGEDEEGVESSDYTMSEYEDDDANEESDVSMEIQDEEVLDLNYDAESEEVDL